MTSSRWGPDRASSQKRSLSKFSTIARRTTSTPHLKRRTALRVKSHSNSELAVELPTEVSPGSYRLTIGSTETEPFAKLSEISDTRNTSVTRGWAAG
jgi:hypothetical protein